MSEHWWISRKAEEIITALGKVEGTLRPSMVESATHWLPSLGRQERNLTVLEGVDLAALNELLLRVSRLAADFPEIVEMDLNPIFAYPAGRAPTAGARPDGAARSAPALSPARHPGRGP